MKNMLRTAVLAGTSSASLRWPAFAADKPKVQIMPEDQVKAGMHGVAYTVFEGVTPEADGRRDSRRSAAIWLVRSPT